MPTQKIFRKVAKNTGDDAIKLAPQEQVLFDTIPATKGGIERKDLLAALEALTTGDKPALKTKQPVSIILGYYTKHLVDSGLVEVEKIVTEPAKKEAAAKAA